MPDKAKRLLQAAAGWMLSL